MNILLVFATEMEAQSFSIPETEHSIEILVTGVASYNAVYKLTKPCLMQEIDLVVHAGIAGAFDSALAIGTVVQVTEDLFADIGVWEQGCFKTLSDLNLLESEDLNIDKDGLQTSLQKVRGITVHTITSTNEQKQEWLKKYNPQVESMEGAAVHFVCKQEKIPCIHIRAISNYVGVRDKNQWNIKLALENLHAELSTILSRIED